MTQMTELRRFDTVPLEQVATLNGTRCTADEDCDLVRGHETTCAVVSPAGLVHEILEPVPALSDDEQKMMERIHNAYTDLQRAEDEINFIERDLLLKGPQRVWDAIKGSSMIVQFDWPIPDEEDDWADFLDGRY